MWQAGRAYAHQESLQLNNLVEALNKIVESDEPAIEYVVQQTPTTIRQKVGLWDAVKGYIETEKK